jgi:hypothetical protein
VTQAFRELGYETQRTIQKGELSLNTARKIVSVITPETQNHWLEKAKTLQQKELEREIVKTHPEKRVRSRIKPITETKSELRCLIDKDLESLIERIQDLESQRTQRPVTLEEALMAMAKLFLEKKDPIEKAKRCHEREKVKVTTPANEMKAQVANFSARRKIPTPILRKVHLRDKGQCQAPKCQEKRWLQVHHLKPWAYGGGHELNNLLTLCFFHHRRVHSP